MGQGERHHLPFPLSGLLLSPSLAERVGQMAAREQTTSEEWHMGCLFNFDPR